MYKYPTEYDSVKYEKDEYSYDAAGVEQFFNDDIVLFPNPSEGIINITGLTQPAVVKIYSIQGQLLKSFKQVENTIDILDLKPGIYILNLREGNQILVRKVVKE